MSDNDSLAKRFFRQLFFTLLIQLVFLVFACLSYGATDKVIYFRTIIITGCAAAAILNILFTAKCGLKIWEKLIIILLMPTNFTYILLDRYGLAHKVFVLFEGIFGKLSKM